MREFVVLTFEEDDIIANKLVRYLAGRHCWHTKHGMIKYYWDSNFVSFAQFYFSH